MPNLFPEILKNCGFVRETQDDLITLIKAGADINDVIARIIPPGQSRTGFYTLSVYLYGFIPTKRLYEFDFYFFCDGLYKRMIKDREGKEYILTYRYSPISESENSNLCHFELGVYDPEKGQYIPKDAKSSKLKNFVDTIYEEYLCKLVCIDPSSLRKWDVNDNHLLADCI